MNSIGRSLAYSALSQYSVHIITFVSIVIIARILTPQEIGVYAVAGSMSLLAAELRAMGVGQYLVREKELDRDKIRAALGLTVTVSWGLGLLIAIAAPFAADFYEEPAIRNILWILCVSFAFGPFTAVPYALWTRNMQFEIIFLQRFLGSLTHAGASVAFILMDFSYYGLALGATAGFISELLIAIYLRPNETVWMPSLSGAGKILRFGLYMSSNNLFGRFAESIPDLVIGRIATMTQVGIFSRGLGVILFISKIITSAVYPVVLPHFSNVNREGKSIADAYLKAMRLQGAISWPVFAVVSVTAYPLIHALFGDQWDMAVPIASIIALWAILAAVHVFSAPALLASGREDLAFFAGLVIAISRFVLILAGAQFGLEMIAWAIVGSGVIELILKTWAIKKSTGLEIRKMIKGFAPNILIAVICWLVAELINILMPFTETNPFLALAVVIGCMSITWLGLLRLTRHEAWEIIVNLAGGVIHRAKAAGRSQS